MGNSRIKFRHLQCFLAVAEQNSLLKAAATLSITQPAVTKSIQELEEILQVKLFERSRLRTVLTPQAEVFFSYAQASVAALQQGENLMGGPRNFVKPVIRIGVTPAIAPSFVPQALLAFRRRMPSIQISVASGTTEYLMTQLREHHVDFALCRHCDPEQMVGLSFEYLYADPFVVVARPNHPLLQSPIAKDNEICPYTALLPPKTSVNRRAVDSFAIALGTGQLSDFIESVSISLARSYVIRSDAIWFVSWSAVKHDVEAGALVKLSPPTQNGSEPAGVMARSTGLMMRSNYVPTADIQLLINTIRECALEERRTEIF